MGVTREAGEELISMGTLPSPKDHPADLVEPNARLHRLLAVKAPLRGQSGCSREYKKRTGKGMRGRKPKPHRGVFCQGYMSRRHRGPDPHRLQGHHRRQRHGPL